MAPISAHCNMITETNPSRNEEVRVGIAPETLQQLQQPQQQKEKKSAKRPKLIDTQLPIRSLPFFFVLQRYASSSFKEKEKKRKDEDKAERFGISDFIRLQSLEPYDSRVKTPAYLIVIEYPEAVIILHF